MIIKSVRVRDPVTHFLCLDLQPKWEASVTAATRELQKLLALHTGFQCEITCLPEARVSGIRNCILGSKDFNSAARTCFKATHSHPDKSFPTKLLVVCPPDHHLAKLAKKSLPTAVYGAANSFFAAVYHESKQVIWHEILHLLGADDCYQLSKSGDVVQRECRDLPNCIMQYDPEESNGEWPFLCDRNIALLK